MKTQQTSRLLEFVFKTNGPSFSILPFCDCEKKNHSHISEIMPRVLEPPSSVRILRGKKKKSPAAERELHGVLEVTLLRLSTQAAAASGCAEVGVI